ncbi:hypothetical protein E2C01_008179 [Portunus trituberculatus]|uniref:Uncharacterized protein n=1 Tax=Portunus trituberculatus TaxID=210409 RepID=A0A5B7D129_PORTR|nr:hypothetical protein [Portunus trituberculatus]
MFAVKDLFVLGLEDELDRWRVLRSSSRPRPGIRVPVWRPPQTCDVGKKRKKKKACVNIRLREGELARDPDEVHDPPRPALLLINLGPRHIVTTSARPGKSSHNPKTSPSIRLTSPHNAIYARDSCSHRDNIGAASGHIVPAAPSQT